MIKTSARIALLLFVLTICLTSMAYADGASFRLRIQDSSGAAVVMDATPNSATNMNTSTNSQQIAWAGYLGGSLDWFNVVVAYTAPSGTHGATLSLSADVQRSAGTAGAITLSLEDSPYAATIPATAVFSGLLQGLPSIQDVFTPTAALSLSGQASNASFQTWLNDASSTPNFGANGVYDGSSTVLTPATVSIPAGSPAALSGADAGLQTNGASFTSGPDSSVNVNINNPYFMMSQSTINFGGAGEASFTFTSQVVANSGGPNTAVPEPSSLLLLGSGFIGFGVALRRKYGRTV